MNQAKFLLILAPTALLCLQNMEDREIEGLRTEKLGCTDIREWKVKGEDESNFEYSRKGGQKGKIDGRLVELKNHQKEQQQQKTSRLVRA